MEKKFELYTYSESMFDSNTAFFYFIEEGKRDLLFVEYWVDEDCVAKMAQYCTRDGYMLEDEMRELTEQEQDYFAQVCRKEIHYV